MRGRKVGNRSENGKQWAGPAHCCASLGSLAPQPEKDSEMASVNKVILVGNLGRDPEIRYTQQGTAVANFSLATTDRFKNRSGEMQERTEWHRIVAWDKLAEICGQYLAKGRQVYIEGRLQTRDWEDKDGNKRSTTEVVAQTMQMLGRRDGPGGGGGGGSMSSGSEPMPDAPEGDEIPF